MNRISENSRVALANLILLIMAGISVSWWVLYYTDAFPVFGGMLGLGGLFTWIAFVGNILTSERKEEIQNFFDQCFLQKRLMLLLLIIFLSGWWLGLVPARSTLLVDSLESATGHVLDVREFYEECPFSLQPIRRVKLSPRSTAKVVLPTPWFGSKDYFIKVSSFPAKKITVSGYRRERLFIPKMLIERPVVLIRPAAMDSSLVSNDFKMEILMNNEQKPAYTIPEYQGQSLWLGADADVDVPQKLITKWYMEFKGAGMREDGVSNWLPPVSLAPAAEFPGSTVITVNLKNRDNEIKYSGKLTIQPSGKARYFPEEIILHEK
ncbi:MAG: hypothetical protein KAR13_00815 [Desulfobulbaceae bacterium]|nr:hypothetical protein [Desulfobulbaceae bacterium]